MTIGETSRNVAVGLLDAVLGQGRMMSQAVQEDAALRALEPGARARAQRLALDVIRQLEPIERLLAPRLRKAPPLHVMNILRLAVAERAMGAAAHGVVHAAVEMARAGGRRSQHLAGMVNAVLRGLPDPVVLAGPAQMLPRWLRQPLVHAYGREAVSAIERQHAAAPPIDLTLRRGVRLAQGQVLPTGSVRLRGGGQVSALDGYAQGAFWVQDAAAALAVPLLGPVAGIEVLDICAAPGGKTMQLADAGAQVTALDISAPRMARLQQNLARTGLQATCLVQDALSYTPPAPFAAIVLDAPCSASGTIRRHPELPYLKDGSEVPDLVALQTALIDRALAWLAPQGRLVYATCSLLPAEGEDQLTAMLSRHPDLRICPPQIAGIDPSWITPQGALRLRPDYWAEWGGMDGFFMVCLQKP